VPSNRPTLGLSEASDHIRARSFPDAALDLIGVELEWLVVADGADRYSFRDQLGDLVLPGGSALSTEPGGQLELSSRPASSLGALCTDLGHDVDALGGAVRRGGRRLLGMGLAPDQPVRRCLSTPRYDAMAAFFDADGPAGSIMMTSTASVQVNVGLGAPGEREVRWRRANLLGPLLAAAFATSPLAGGAPTGRASTRLGVWAAIDATRTASAWQPGESCDSWTAYVLDARVMLIRSSETEFVPMSGPLTFRRWLADGHELGYPTIDDLDYHLTTLFPPVRPKGWLELRFLDALPTPWWQVAAAVTAAVVRHPDAGARAERAARPFAGCWAPASVYGLGHPGLHGAAGEVFAAASEVLGDLGADADLIDAVAEYAACFVVRDRTPADDRLDAFTRTGSPLLGEDDRHLVGASR